MQAFLNRWMPIDVSAHGAQLDRLNTWVHWLMLVLFVGWGIYFIYVLTSSWLVLYYQRRTNRDGPNGLPTKIPRISEINMGHGGREQGLAA